MPEKRNNEENINNIVFIDSKEELTSKFQIPIPFEIEDGELFEIKKGESLFVCRQVPFLIKKYDNVENHTVSYELYWFDGNIEKRKVIPSQTIAIKKELLTLTEFGLGFNENNYKQVIKYFDSFLSKNKIEQEIMVNRLGHIKKGFIHPNLENNIKIVPNDYGEKQILDAFQEKGTVDSWKSDVLDLVKKFPKSLFYIVASFAAPLLEELQIDSFIVDFSGHTSQGKTTLLRLASTIWGTQALINEWNATKVSIERKAAFLNSFPLLMDDTKKANAKQLESIVYQFSGGRSKGRGSVKGFQEDLTWKTIMLSTGESSILDYTKGGGVAGRVVPLEDEPFGKSNHEFMEQLYKGINSNYGVVGRVFIEKWLNLSPENKENLIQKFHEIRSHYSNLAGKNEVLIRTAAYFALIHFVSILLNKTMDFQIDPEQFENLFKQINKENRSTDKPKQIMEDILDNLDSFRSSIHYGFFEPSQINGLFTTKDNQLYLTVSFVNEFLGPEARATKREWLKRGYIVPQKNGKEYDGKSMRGKKYKVIQVNPDLIKELGFDFSVDEEDNN